MEGDVNPPVRLPPLAERNVATVLARWVAEQPGKLAVRDLETELTYAELHDQALSLAGGLQRLGASPGEAILLMLDNHVDFVRAWIGLSLSGRLEVTVNTAYLGAILAHVINDSAATMMVVEAAYLPRIVEIADSLVRLKTLVVRGRPGMAIPSRFEVVDLAGLTGPAGPAAELAPSDLIGIMYTSGTTGLSKGVRITHAHAYGYASPAVFGAVARDDVALVTLPLFHVGGQWAGVYNALIAGASAVVVPRFSATRFWDDVRRFGCTHTLLLGAMANFLFRQPPRPDDADHPMRRVLMSPVIPDLDAFRERFGVEKVGTAFGSTEASTMFRAPPGHGRYGASGWLRDDFDARVVHPDDTDVEPGGAGELVVRAREPWVLMDGYHGRPDATVEAWRNLWLHTGDLVRIEASGELVFLDRLTDSIRRRGENVSSQEVEREINGHPAVLECAVIAVPSEATEDDIKACIVLRDGVQASPDQVMAFLAPRLPYFMLPRYIEFYDRLPKTPTEKIQKKELRARGHGPGAWDGETSSRRTRGSDAAERPAESPADKVG